jgi:exodeoxyribonuclease V gamma subunit
MVMWMKQYPLGPLENEVVLVQSNGIAQWLRLAIAADAGEDESCGGGCGIAAALDVTLPARFLWQAYRTVLGRAAVPETSPMDESRLVWRIMRMLPELLHQPEYAPLMRFLEDDGDCRKRFQLAQRIADLFDQYQVYRADWLVDWENGRDVLAGPRGNAVPLADGQRWQATLWRALQADVREHAQTASCMPNAGRAAIHEAFMRRASDWQGDGRPKGLPRRVIVFGLSSLPRQSLEALAALATWAQVLVCVQNPCRHYWADIVPDKDLLRATRSRQQRRQGCPDNVSEDQLHLHAHPLLAAWGKQGRDFIGLLDEHDSDEARTVYGQRFAAMRQKIDLFSPHEERCDQTTLLQQLQDDILDLRPLSESCCRWPGLNSAQDQSIQFHVAHGALREVEILHDRLLAAFDADPSLQPRDIIVMVPDINAYAPHIRAVFSLPERDDARHIPYNLADQGREHFDPLVHAVGKLLGLPHSRFAASDLFDLLEVPALRQRFGIGAEDVPLLQRWIRGANVRWQFIK